MKRTLAFIAAVSLLAVAGAAQASAIHGSSPKKEQRHVFDRRFETKRPGEFGLYSAGQFVIRCQKFHEQARGRRS